MSYKYREKYAGKCKICNYPLKNDDENDLCALCTGKQLYRRQPE